MIAEITPRSPRLRARRIRNGELIRRARGGRPRRRLVEIPDAERCGIRGIGRGLGGRGVHARVGVPVRSAWTPFMLRRERRDQGLPKQIKAMRVEHSGYSGL